MRLLYLAPAHTVNMLSARFEFEFLFTIYHFLFQFMSFSVFDKMSYLLLFSFRWFTHIPRNHLSGIAIATDKREPIRVNKKTINLLEISEFYYWNHSKYSKRWKKQQQYIGLNIKFVEYPLYVSNQFDLKCRSTCHY